MKSWEGLLPAWSKTTAEALIMKCKLGNYQKSLKGLLMLLK